MRLARREVCESLDDVDERTSDPVVRCCIESICDEDDSEAFHRLTGQIQQAILEEQE